MPSRSGGPEVDPVSLYSPLTGLVYIFNLIVGTGALTLPAAFHDAGWLLSTVIIVMLAFMSYMTATFMIEAMAAANAMVHWRRLQRLKKSGGPVSDELVQRTLSSVHQPRTASPVNAAALQQQQQGSEGGSRNGSPSRSSSLPVTPARTGSNPSSLPSSPGGALRTIQQQHDSDYDESEPLIRAAPLPEEDPSNEALMQLNPDIADRGSVPRNVSAYYDITEVIEMGKMASMFFSKSGRTLFYVCITVYLYGDLAIYGAAVAKSMRDVACTFKPPNATSGFNISDSEICWEGNEDMTRLDAYRVALALFTAVVGPFAFCNVNKTKYLQILTTFMRWAAFGCMVTLACIRLSKGHVADPAPPMANLGGLPNLFGVCVYSFMCHHSLPSLVTPISNKRRLTQLIVVDYLIILCFYFLLAFTGIFAFSEINDLYTLNFQPKPGEPWYLAVIHYFLSLFPVFTLSTNFPIIAITLRNNLKALFLTEGRMYSWGTRSCVFPLLALAPPIAVAFATNSLEFLVGITGSYAGAGIQYIVPALLVYNARRATQKAIGVGVKNDHRSWFRATFWVVFVNLWAVGCVVLVTWNHIKSAVAE